MRFLVLAASVLMMSSMVFSPVFAAGEKVSVTGCAVPGVESGCIVITDTQSGKVYEITAIKSGSKPFDIGQRLVIVLTGTVFDGVSICMQGPILKDIEWDYTKMQCPDADK